MQVLGIVLLLLSHLQIEPSEKLKVWVYFEGKSHPVCEYDVIQCHLLPPDRANIDAFQIFGFDIVNTSNWLNAIVIQADSTQIESVRRLDFVTDVQPVGRFSPAHSLSYDVFPSLDEVPSPFGGSYADLLMNVYGQSANQLLFHRIDQVHDLGFDGSGVIVGIMDGGFDVSHEVFEHLRSNQRILAERDFVDGGNDTKRNVSDPIYHSHGTSVAAIIAGMKEGTLMGVAPGVSLVLARTEDDKQEAPIEEDNWVAAIEWMQTLGVQVVNSSLGYSIFDSQPTASYSYEDMDGKTSAIARAATKAATVFNMVVVVSAGNEGNSTWRYITTPADADSILAVGSLTSTGVRISSSSVGPTSDGRIKPDVSARGHSVFSAKSDPANSYGNVSGTSFAAPHVAGMMALALQARPGMAAIWYVRQAQKASSKYPNPDNLTGYGKIDALDLISGVTTSIQDESTPNLPDDLFVVRNFPNPFNPSTTISYEIPVGWSLQVVTIIDVMGRTVATVNGASVSASGTLQWNGFTTEGFRAASGIYFAKFQFTNGAVSKVQLHPMSLVK